MYKRIFIVFLFSLLVVMMMPVLANASKDLQFNERVGNMILTEEYRGTDTYYFTVPEAGVVTFDTTYSSLTYNIALYTSGEFSSYLGSFAVSENTDIKYALQPVRMVILNRMNHSNANILQRF